MGSGLAVLDPLGPTELVFVDLAGAELVGARDGVELAAEPLAVSPNAVTPAATSPVEVTPAAFGLVGIAPDAVGLVAVALGPAGLVAVAPAAVGLAEVTPAVVELEVGVLVVALASGLVTPAPEVVDVPNGRTPAGGAAAAVVAIGPVVVPGTEPVAGVVDVPGTTPAVEAPGIAPEVGAGVAPVVAAGEVLAVVGVRSGVVVVGLTVVACGLIAPEGVTAVVSVPLDLRWVSVVVVAGAADFARGAIVAMAEAGEAPWATPSRAAREMIAAAGWAGTTEWGVVVLWVTATAPPAAAAAAIIAAM